MVKVKEFRKKVAALYFWCKSLRRRYIAYTLRSEDAQQIFTAIYKNNAWGGKDSVSGAGSDSHQTWTIVQELPQLFRDLGISTILDIPCGDFNWMKNVQLGGIEYMGADIVDDLIERNIEQHERHNVNFHKINLIEDKLPKADLVFTRDCLVHFSFEDIFNALENLCNSQSEYFLTTTFVGRAENHDIATGKWRALNLELAPFALPRPLKIINEGCTEDGGTYADKALGLWKISDIRKALGERHNLSPSQS